MGNNKKNEQNKYIILFLIFYNRIGLHHVNIWNSFVFRNIVVNVRLDFLETFNRITYGKC